MNHKLRLWVLTAGLQAGLLGGEACAQAPGGPESDPPAENKPAPPKPRIRWPKPPKLPEQYRSKDTDKDGQIGMYEWPRADYRTFRKLDLNHDGFLTAEELIRGPSTKPSGLPVVASAAGSPPASDSASSNSAPSDSPKPDSAPPAPAAPAPAAPPAGSDAERQWDLLDRDKDGKVTDQEWEKSLFTRPKFRDAGVKVPFPLAREEFIRLYQQVVSGGGK